MEKFDDVPLITVVTVTYNVVNELLITLENVKQLKKKHLIEYIVIDGGSSDETVNLIKDDPAVRYWVSEKDKGIYDAMNKGWQQARDNSYILYLGAGDTVIQLPAADKLKSGYDVIIGEAKMFDNTVFTSKADFRLKLGNTIHHQAMMVKKSVHLLPPFNINYKIYSDFDFNQRLYKANKKFFYDSAFIVAVAEAGASKKLDINEMTAIVEKNYNGFWKLLSKIYLTYQKSKIND